MSVGGKVILSEGTFNIATAISPISQSIIEGMGPKITVVKVASGINYNVLYSNAKNHMLFKNFSIDGNKSIITDGGNSSNQRLLRLYDCQDIWVQNIEFLNFWWGGLGIEGDALNVNVDSCIASGGSNHLAAFMVNPINAGKTIAWVRFAQCFASFPARENVGFVVADASSYVSFVNCQTLLCDNGFSTSKNTTSPSHLLWVNCSSYNATVGMHIQNAVNSILGGCMVIDSQNESVILEGTNAVNILGGHMSGAGQGAALHNSILVTTSAINCIVDGVLVKNTLNDADAIRIHGSTYNRISNNICFDDQGVKTQAYGIAESGGSNYNTISNNDVSRNKTGGILRAGAATQIHGNRGHWSANLPVGVPTTQTKSAAYTMTATDSGYVTVIDTDAVVITLPATAAGLTYTFVNGGLALGSVGFNISPNAADLISGVGLTAADNKDLINTKATAHPGDIVTIVGNGGDGWVVQSMSGVWAREA